jgi:hypothetical protein
LVLFNDSYTAPDGDKALDTIVFDLKYGKPLPVKSWKVDILENGGCGSFGNLMEWQ